MIVEKYRMLNDHLKITFTNFNDSTGKVINEDLFKADIDEKSFKTTFTYEPYEYTKFEYYLRGIIVKVNGQMKGSTIVNNNFSHSKLVLGKYFIKWLEKLKNEITYVNQWANKTEPEPVQQKEKPILEPKENVKPIKENIISNVVEIIKDEAIDKIDSLFNK